MLDGVGILAVVVHDDEQVQAEVSRCPKRLWCEQQIAVVLHVNGENLGTDRERRSDARGESVSEAAATGSPEELARLVEVPELQLVARQGSIRQDERVAADSRTDFVE